MPATRHDPHAKAPQGPLPFVAAAWTALVTAIVCALLPLGSPHARAPGSAFDPTTSVVTLSPKSQNLRSDEKRVAKASRPDRGGHALTGSDVAGCAPVAPAIPVRRPPAASPRALPEAPAPRLRCRAGLGARAPPLA